ncbi:glycosyltransferase family 4 protein [Coraliomargarita sp. SDUM461003]|uniref:Glycosyltransferase family 4 protein n=1 Tax=Thalassobacterium maritimum TaxID=3041265 RepID=A0ABU1AVN4_9BACT|nr:glycosyltransferase family 4 protein [Coraliomargarita sp. SDUM461003]MDQ8208219.1 glycosyltransferase family 4 protein [Coraliomargarita sp. SDUM461003]
MKIFFHDFGDYPLFFSFTAELARRHEHVTHAYVELLSVDRSGSLAVSEPCYEVKRLQMPGDYQAVKYSFFKRFNLEARYARVAATAVVEAEPDLVLSANAPTHVQSALQQAARESGARFICWTQDFYCEAVRSILHKKFGPLGGLIGNVFHFWERRQIRQCDGVLVITEGFRQQLHEWGYPDDQVEVMANWAPIESLPVLAQENDWSREHGLVGKFCFLYSGTMGLKHNPELLLQCAERYARDPSVRIVVVAEGTGADYLREQLTRPELNGCLIVLPMQAAARVPEVLATASVLIATLEPEASHICVPSKVLTYLCAARPLLLSVADKNLAAETVRTGQAGFTAAPDRADLFMSAADRLRQDEALCRELGANARRYAEASFQIERIVDQFERFMGRVL